MGSCLIRLDLSCDPVWFYLNHCHSYRTGTWISDLDSTFLLFTINFWWWNNIMGLMGWSKFYSLRPNNEANEGISPILSCHKSVTLSTNGQHPSSQQLRIKLGNLVSGDQIVLRRIGNLSISSRFPANACNEARQVLHMDPGSLEWQLLPEVRGMSLI